MCRGSKRKEHVTNSAASHAMHGLLVASASGCSRRPVPAVQLRCIQTQVRPFGTTRLAIGRPPASFNAQLGN
eukprot:5246319-Heterocapsa_arctica.AAC.1